MPIGGRRADGVDDVLADRPASGYGSPQGYPHCCITQQSSSTYPLFSRSRWHAAFRISYGTPHGYLPSPFGRRRPAGPICLNRLHSLGVVCKLDNDNAYSYHDSRTLYGRASIISTLMPSRSVACARQPLRGCGWVACFPTRSTSFQKRITERRGTVAKSAFSTDRRPTSMSPTSARSPSPRPHEPHATLP